MTELSAVYRRVLRRETHASRTAPAVAVVSVLLVGILGAVAAVVWGSFDARIRDGLATTLQELRLAPALALAAGIAILLLGLLLLGAGVLPGRNSRRQRTSARIGVLCDATVLANAVADGVAMRCGIGRGQVSVNVGTRAVAVRITPTSGVPQDPRSVTRAAEAVLRDAGFPASVRVSIASQGVLA
ncbi:conserved hypothetical protein [Leucobacter sp. 7(1)]|uniref:hypothetical protein n=1 Tax=Leucobacter sp. 7(1) TaxID=1255613 RepID=UPI00097EE009|nr:hypothetical protein [Leucobacter sp. 7(1)]SJN10793.1 conserved hypothetical protein [Leucobacter sp. 7(1)]